MSRFSAFSFFSCLCEPSGNPLGTLSVTVGVPGALLGDPWRQNVATCLKNDVLFFALDSRGRPERPKGAQGPQNVTKMPAKGIPRGSKSQEKRLGIWVSLLFVFPLFFLLPLLSFFSVLILVVLFLSFSSVLCFLFPKLFVFLHFLVFIFLFQRERERERERDSETEKQTCLA